MSAAIGTTPIVVLHADFAGVVVDRAISHVVGTLQERRQAVAHAKIAP